MLAQKQYGLVFRTWMCMFCMCRSLRAHDSAESPRNA